MSTYKYFSPKTDPKIDWDKVDHYAIAMLDEARRIAGVPFRITSHYRTKEEDIKLAGFAGAHTEIKCSAFDIAYKNSVDAHAILRGLFRAGFIRIGVNFKNLHIHCDNDKTRPHPAFWIE